MRVISLDLIFAGGVIFDHECDRIGVVFLSGVSFLIVEVISMDLTFARGVIFDHGSDHRSCFSSHGCHFRSWKSLVNLIGVCFSARRHF